VAGKVYPIDAQLTGVVVVASKAQVELHSMYPTGVAEGPVRYGAKVFLGHGSYRVVVAVESPAEVFPVGHAVGGTRLWVILYHNLVPLL